MNSRTYAVIRDNKLYIPVCWGVKENASWFGTYLPGPASVEQAFENYAFYIHNFDRVIIGGKEFFQTALENKLYSRVPDGKERINLERRDAYKTECWVFTQCKSNGARIDPQKEKIMFKSESEIKDDCLYISEEDTFTKVFYRTKTRGEELSDWKSFDIKLEGYPVTSLNDERVLKELHKLQSETTFVETVAFTEDAFI
ncbi:MAG: hypothetical protein ACW99G_18200, partial [Candidatus Thorarchaeota archaeon]